MNGQKAKAIRRADAEVRRLRAAHAHDYQIKPAIEEAQRLRIKGEPIRRPS